MIASLESVNLKSTLLLYNALEKTNVSLFIFLLLHFEPMKWPMNGFWFSNVFRT